MPRNVRNAWVDVNIDGRETRLSGGPVGKSDGMSMTLKVRDNGGVMDAVSVYVSAGEDGAIRTRVYDETNGKLVHELITLR